MNKNNEYKVVNRFVCCGKQMITVVNQNGAHVMEELDWKTLNTETWFAPRKDEIVKHSNVA